MSQRLINLSDDLKKLRDEGYGVDVRSGCLVVDPIVYLTAGKEVAQGRLVVRLNLASDEKLLAPDDHVAYFSGEMPCDVSGAAMERLAVDHNETELAGVRVQHRFSRHPVGRNYRDYYEQVTTYDELISGPAAALFGVTSRTFPFIDSVEEGSVFHYTDTASSRAEIERITQRLAIGKVAIIGVGGTGSYVLDLVAKTPVSEIHIFDGDRFSQHNAFRAPGAASKSDLQAQVSKVDYLAGRYSNMHRHVMPHGYHLTEANVDELRDMAFVFMCFDETKAKRFVVEKLEEVGIPFINVGMGLNVAADKLTGMLSTVLSTPENRAVARGSIPLQGGEGANEYATNIQIADLNALNAALAVIKWKKHCGFYADVTRETSSLFKVSSNVIVNTDAV